MHRRARGTASASELLQEPEPPPAGELASAPSYTAAEEVLHVVTHGVGLLLSIVGLVVLLHGGSVLSKAIYGATLVTLYGGSTLYHAAREPRWRHVARIVDHSAIYLLIAGTYTPFTLVTLRGPWGWTLFGLVWGLAAVGMAREAWGQNRSRGISLALYLGMGWIVVVAAEPLLRSLPPAGVRLLLAGGLFYTAGTAFYARKGTRYAHAVWHAFVLAGSACHFAAVALYVAPG